MDVRPTMGEPRAYGFEVLVADELSDEYSTFDRLDVLFDAVAEGIRDDPEWGIDPAEFAQEQIADGRVIVSWRIPIARIA